MLAALTGMEQRGFAVSGDVGVAIVAQHSLQRVSSSATRAASGGRGRVDVKMLVLKIEC